MNNSGANARTAWKCEQSAARTARWTRNIPKKKRTFAPFFFIITITMYFNDFGVTGRLLMQTPILLLIGVLC